MNAVHSTIRTLKRTFANVLSILIVLAAAFPAAGGVSAEGPTPRIVASEAGDWFWTTDFIPGTLDLFVYESESEGEGVNLLWSGQQEADEWGFTFVGYDAHGLNLAPGNYLVVADEATEKGIVLETITMEVFDTDHEIMAGTAPLGREVWARPGPQEWQESIMVTADPISGAWMADFKTIDFDITEDMRPWSYAHIYDADGDANEAGTPPAPPSTWRDEFDGSLRDGWYWKNGDSGQWNLDDVPGFLRMYASDTVTPNGNLLLRGAANGDFMIKTRLLFEPDTDFQFAGLVIWQDEENFLQLGRAFCDVEGACVGNGIYFDKVLGGNLVDGNFAATVDSPNEAYLRLERRGDMVRAFFSYEGITWFEIGTHWIPSDFQVNGVGLTSSQDYNTPDRDIPADFDFFELNEGWGFLPEGFHDFDGGDVPDWACNVGGWAADPDDRAVDLAIEVNVDGASLPEWLYAGEYREDLDNAGVCVDGNCSFFASLWGVISSYEPHSVVVYAQDVPSGEWVQLSNSPKTLTCRTYDIYAFDPQTGETRQITDLRDTHEFNPKWSQDGKKIVHDVWNTDWSAHGVYITDVKTGASAPLAGAEGGSYPTWSPNGKLIAFDRGADGDFRLFIVPSAGGDPKLVAEDAFMATWSQNSKRLAFHRPSDGSIRTVGLNGQNETLVVETGNAPAWSPDGKWIAFERDGNIWKVRVDNAGNPLGEPVQLTGSPFWEGRPTWSNNNKTIAFHAGWGRDTDIWTVPAAGGESTWVTGALEFGDYDPNYSLDGRHIAYASFSPNAQAERVWIAAYSYDLPAGSLPDGAYPYHFDFEWSLPEPGTFSGQGGEFVLSGSAPVHEGNVLLRGPFELRGVDTPEGLVCEEVEEINPDQAMRFLIGWVPGVDEFIPMSYADARAHFESITARAIWGDGTSADLVRHEVFPWTSQVDWPAYVCTFTR